MSLPNNRGSASNKVSLCLLPSYNGSSPVAEEGSPGKALRFSASGLAKQRQRLGLSAREVGALLGVSALSVYKWETGKVRSRARQLEAIASLRGLGKREAAARLEATACGRGRQPVSAAL